MRYGPLSRRPRKIPCSQIPLAMRETNDDRSRTKDQGIAPDGLERGAAEETSGLAEHASPLRERDEIFEQARVQAGSDQVGRTLRPDFLESNRVDVRKKFDDIDAEFRERLDKRAREAGQRVEDHAVAQEPVIGDTPQA